MALFGRRHPTSGLPTNIVELAAAVIPADGWAVYGGSRLGKDVFSGDLNDPSYHAMMEASLDFLRQLGIPMMRLNGYESSFWTNHKGQTKPWIEARPRPVNPVLTDVRAGEVQRIAQIEAPANSNGTGTSSSAGPISPLPLNRHATPGLMTSRTPMPNQNRLLVARVLAFRPTQLLRLFSPLP